MFFKLLTKEKVDFSVDFGTDIDLLWLYFFESLFIKLEKFFIIFIIYLSFEWNLF